MVDRNSCGQRRRDLLGRVGDFTHIDARRHRRRRDDRVENVGDHDRPDGDSGRKQSVGEPVDQADEEEHDRVVDHDVPVADLVDQPPDQRAAEDVDRGADADQQRHFRRVEPVNQDQHERGEGDENLLARAVEDFEHVEFPEFPAEVEPRPPDLLRLGQFREAGEVHGGQQDDDDDPDEVIERFLRNLRKMPPGEEEHPG